MNTPPSHYKIPVGISSCLLGERVRYDGGHKRDAFIVETLGKYFEFISFCPEVNIGLGIPRKTIKLVNKDRAIHCVSTVDENQDLTGALVQCAEQQVHWHKNICAYIFKKGSPSCGPGNVKVHQHRKTAHSGNPINANTATGIYAAQLIKNFPNLPVAAENQLADENFLRKFIAQVFMYHRRKKAIAEHTIDSPPI